MMSKTIRLAAINPNKKPITLIWLHGLGTDISKAKILQHDLERFAKIDNIRLVLPSAPARFVSTIKRRLPAWYDLYSESMLRPTREDLEGMSEAMEVVQATIDEERRNNPDAPIILGGFSQGAVVALLSAMAQTIPLLAVILFSGYVPAHPRFNEISDLAREIPIFMAHGTIDPFIPMVKAEEGFTALVQSKANIEFHRYPIMHEVCPDEFKDLGHFLHAHIDRFEKLDEQEHLQATASLEESFHKISGTTKV